MALDVSKLKLVKKGPNGQITAQCPVCAAAGSDKSGNHLSVLPSGAFNCIVGSKEDVNHNRNIRALLRGDSVDGDIEWIDPEPRQTIDKVYPESALATLLPDYSHWLKRGVSEPVLKSLEYGVAPKGEKGKLAGRAVFPVRNLDGKIVGFTGRLIEENSFAPKWKHLMKASKVAYPWNVTGGDITRTKTAVLVESVGDLAAVLTHDIKPVLCIFGLNLSDLIVGSLIGADVRRVFVSLNRDADPRKGQAAADKIARRLAPFISDVRIRLPNGFKDWGCAAVGGEAGLAELKAFREEVS